jgi:formate dehydrogenase iron-sulfur subunit
MLADPEDVSVIYLLVDAPENYHENSVAHRFQPPMDRKIFLSMLGRPLRRSVGAILKL